MLKGVGTTIAVDNIDQATSSMTATGSLHGTCISVTQHPTAFKPGMPQETVEVKKVSSTKLLSLPESYTFVPEVIMPDRIAITNEYMLNTEVEPTLSSCALMLSK